jgi:SPP1 gp7 family putative phage head morphogenesis protein
MKREITAARETSIKAKGSPRAQEREFERLLIYMVEQLSQRFRNQVFGELHVATVEKFADAQVGNYASVYLKLADKVRRKLLKQFDDKRIKELVETILNKVNRGNRDELYAKVEARIGLNSTELTNTEGLNADINALVLETTRWVQKLRDETLEEYTANSLRAMTQGDSLESIMKQFDGLVEKRKNHAKSTARNQIANFNSMATKIRAQNLGITRARWITSRNERVRESHKDRDGKEFDLSEGFYSSLDRKYLLPGTDYQCQCDYELIIPEDD